MVIVMDNVSIHIGREIREVIEAEGHILRFLPPYSPDYNPIELTFAVIKAWIKRHYVTRRQEFQGFGDFLAFAIRESKCGRFAAGQFKHAAGGIYTIAQPIEELMDAIATFESGHTEWGIGILA